MLINYFAGVAGAQDAVGAGAGATFDSGFRGRIFISGAIDHDTEAQLADHEAERDTPVEKVGFSFRSRSF